MLDKKPTTIGRMFDRIAFRYDLINRVLSLCIDQTWRRITVRNLAVEPGDRVLDIATGTGDLALRVLQSEKTCRVVGIDLSQEMLAIASLKSVRRGFSDRSFFVNGDALLLPFHDG
ncbi:MAG TPA: methyltransferase domain-containing protein, partial [Deltaproteobacteria bacterium]|nr:methyltransferase domain-containing protein [Deltaproteobacteria bacterium]